MTEIKLLFSLCADKLDKYSNTVTTNVRDVRADRKGGAPAQCAGLLLQWHRSRWAGRGPSCLGHSRWGWQRLETETKTTDCYTEAAFLQRKTEENPSLCLHWFIYLLCEIFCSVYSLQTMNLITAACKIYQPALFSTLTCELQLAQFLINQCCVSCTSLSLVPLVFSSDLVNKPAQRNRTMQAVADQIPGQRAEKVQIG